MKSLRNPTYRRLFAAQAVSLAGTGLATVALGLLAYDLAGADAGLVLGTVFAIKMVAYVTLAPVASALVHALPRRTVMVGADLVRLAAVLGLPFVTSIWQVYVLVFVLQAASAAHTPTYQAVLPDVLPDEHEYTEALSLSRLAEDLEMVLSPVLAAVVLLVVPASGLFFGTAAGFAVSAVLVAGVRSGRRGDAAGDGEGADDGTSEQPFTARLRRGAQVMVRTPELRPVLALNLAVAAGGAYVLVQYVVIARSVFGQGEGAAAVLLAGLGAGSMTVAVLLPRVLDALPERRVMLTGAAVVTLATALLPLALRASSDATGLAVTGVLFFAVGAGWSAAETPIGRLLTRHSREADLPAVFAAQFSLSHACWLVTYPLAGWLGGIGLGSAAMLLAALAALATLATGMLWPRRLPTPPGLPVAQVDAVVLR